MRTQLVYVTLFPVANGELLSPKVQLAFSYRLEFLVFNKPLCLGSKLLVDEVLSNFSSNYSAQPRDHSCVTIVVDTLLAFNYKPVQRSWLSFKLQRGSESRSTTIFFYYNACQLNLLRTLRYLLNWLNYRNSSLKHKTACSRTKHGWCTSTSATSSTAQDT
jgi:hypothetical protein